MIFLISTIITIIINTLSTTLDRGDMSIKELSDLYFSAITPAGFTFSIWSIIYLGLFGLGIAIVMKKISFPKPALRRYVASCIFNSLRVVVRQYQYLTLSLIVIWLLLGSLLLCYHTIKHDTQRWIRVIKTILLTYIGRVLVASLLMTTVYFTHTAGMWFTDNTTLYAIIALSAGATLNTLFLRGENNQATTLVFLRALYGIYSGQSDEIIQLTTMIIGCIILIQLAIFLGRRLVKYGLRC